ncbi:family 1 encapsulin nanocompartment shell protein [Streptomyces sp. CC208A]|uniref:encapsulin n=1 Tax=Streptomyces sp. CC208A TaxID=3044573 RepID=UPI0024A9A908|nr:family 1 encapsulin nanocompartment shell protein [Streptomyces sp. CC208A]
MTTPSPASRASPPTPGTGSSADPAPATSPFAPLQRPRHRAPATPGDLLLDLRARRADLCFELARIVLDRFGDAVIAVDETHGFTYFDDRDLLGFVEGSENPTRPTATATAAVLVAAGRLTELAAPADGADARLREARPLVELRVPFTVDRSAVDSVERGAKDADRQPVKDAARTLALVAEDRTVFDGPYALLLGAEEYRAVSETSDHGHPIAAHRARMLDGPPIRAPAVKGGFVLPTRGGDFELRPGQDVPIGCTRHDASTAEPYLHETLTCFTCTDEAVVVLET